MSATAMGDAASGTGHPVVVAKHLRRVYPISKGLFRTPDQLQAVSGVSFTVQAGKTLAVVGESVAASQPWRVW